MPCIGPGTIYYPGWDGSAGSVRSSQFYNQVSLRQALIDGVNFEKENTAKRRQVTSGCALLIGPGLPHRSPSDILDAPDCNLDRLLKNRTGNEIAAILSGEARDGYSVEEILPTQDRLHLASQLLLIRRISRQQE